MMQPRPFLFFLVWFSLIVSQSILVTACNNTTPPSENVIQVQLQKQAFNLGYIHGPRITSQDSALLAELHINQAGGILNKEINMVLRPFDTIENTLIDASNMTGADFLPMIIAASSSRTLAIAEQVAIPQNIITFSDTATSPLLTTFPDNDLVFRVIPSDIHQSKVLAEIAFQKGAKSAAMVFNLGDPYGEGLASEFNRVFQELTGGNVTLVPIPESVTVGFDDYMPSVFENHPDVVIVAFLIFPTNSQFINEAINQNFQGQFLLTDVSISPSFSSNIVAPELLQGAVGVSPSKGIESNPEFLFFKNSFEQAFHIEIERFDSNTYDSVILSALATEDAGLRNNTDAPNGLMIKESLRRVMNPPGVKIGPSQLKYALALIDAGEDIDYQGAYSANDFDVNGDVTGTILYDVFDFSQTKLDFVLNHTFTIEVPANP